MHVVVVVGKDNLCRMRGARDCLKVRYILGTVVGGSDDLEDEMPAVACIYILLVSLDR